MHRSLNAPQSFQPVLALTLQKILETWHNERRPNGCIDSSALGVFGNFCTRAGSAVRHPTTIFKRHTLPRHISISIHSSLDSFRGAFYSIISALFEKRLKEDGDPPSVRFNIRADDEEAVAWRKTTHTHAHTLGGGMLSRLYWHTCNTLAEAVALTVTKPDVPMCHEVTYLLVERETEAMVRNSFS